MRSFDLVGRTRKALSVKQVGHCGTLDGPATGVLPIAVGAATKFIPFLSDQKQYAAIIRFGCVTSTDDLTGEVLREAPCAELPCAVVEAELKRFVGSFDQKPPLFAARRINGIRMHDLARRGDLSLDDVRTKHVTIHDIRVQSWTPGAYPEAAIEIDCETGVYVRSVARDCGAAIHAGPFPACIGATVVSIHRTHSNGFHIKNSIAPEQISVAHLLPLDAPFYFLNEVTLPSLSRSLLVDWHQKYPIHVQPTSQDIHLSDKELVRVYAASGDFMGLGQISVKAPKLLLTPLASAIAVPQHVLAKVPE